MACQVLDSLPLAGPFNCWPPFSLISETKAGISRIDGTDLHCASLSHRPYTLTEVIAHNIFVLP